MKRPNLRAESDQHSIRINSEGQSNADAKGQRARWVACSLLVDGRGDSAGIAFMDHPGNPEHPVSWRVDNQLGISPIRCIAGSWQLSAGDMQTNRYRVYVFCGEVDPAGVE
jgi:hypothetical protein